MTLDELKAEVRDASPEVREELFTLLAVLRRARDPERARMLAGKLDDPEHGRELDRRLDSMRAGHEVSLADVRKLHEALTARGL